ncbi:ATP-binding protein [Notoacmeibacter sp. MSK16QG-6]|uniref:sensor histidine kinase n=1 Tax=Notoacmeibacter sp. MSK16QG-6 TaxID=2957982 RepID=UPI0020A113F9|nr:ATP-binding protein [Notoacmeibacter sp. MSK16QG-6]MCP1198541.1 ATP-binding protein [Notoacmeibacter sp. MSK16QG-6]
MRLYPFIDIATLPEVRESFSKGDALAVLSEDATGILWVNGPGASFFGSKAIEDWIGEAAPLLPQARRQLLAGAGKSAPRPLLLRTDRGVAQRQIAVKARQIALPDGSQGVLIIAPGDGEQGALSGFSDDKAVAALLDETGARIVGDKRLDEIDPSPEDLLVMRSRLDREGAASVKQRIQTAEGLVPAALGDLGGEPKRFILFMFLEPVADTQMAEAEPVDSEQSALRFIWETDAEGRFTIISEPFKQIAGMTAAVEQRAFAEVMARLGLDPDKRLSSLMDRQETWSGRTVSWPIAGTAEAIPTDLAALPLYDRERRFLGYRGYGVAHLNEIAPDATGRGLMFAEGWPDQSEQIADSEPPISTGKHTEEISASDVLFEPPALTPSPLRRRTDRPDTRRTRKALTDAETLAFQSIGERLREDSESGAGSTDIEEVNPTDTVAGDIPSSPATSEEGDVSALPDNARTAEFVDAVSEPSSKAVRDDQPEGLDDENARLAIESMGWRRSNKPAPALAARLAALPNRRSQENEAEEIDHGISLQAPQEPLQEGVTGEPDKPDPSDTELEPQRIPDQVESVSDELAESDSSGWSTGGVLGEPEQADDEAVDALDGGITEYADPERSRDDANEDEPNEVAEDRETAIEAPSVPRSTHLTPSALAFLPLPSLVLDRGRIAYASRALLDLTGYHDVAAMESAGGFASLFGEHESSVDERLEGPPLRIVKADGSIAPVNAQMQAIGWNGASALLFAFSSAEIEDAAAQPQPIAVSEDGDTNAGLLSEADAANRAEELAEPLRQHVNELTAILDTATDGVVILTPEGDVRSVNRSGEALFGEDSEALQNRPFRQLFAYESRLTIDSYLASLRESEMASVLNDGREVIGKEKGGGFIPLFITLGKLPADSGYCVVLRDITPWKRVENELRQARRAAEDASAQKTEFLARVSHEVRTPLNAIIGFSELMISERFGPVGNPRYRDYLRDIQKSGNHVLDLVNDLLDISKIEGGHQEMEYEALGLNEVVAEAVAMLQPQANAERVIIRTSFYSGLPDVVADPRSIKQVAINLLTNAVKFTAAGGQVIASTSKNRDGTVALRFRDSGIGMSEEDISQALKPFKQISTLRRSRRDGTGLGLPLTKALVEANKARFSIESQPNIGTLVEVTFPPGRVLN